MNYLAENSRFQAELDYLASRIESETSKIFWIIQQIEFFRSKPPLTHEFDGQQCILTVDTVIALVSTIYSMKIDNKQAYTILQALDGLKVGVANKQSFNFAIANLLLEQYGVTAFKLSFLLHSEIKAIHILIANTFMSGSHPLASSLQVYARKKTSLNTPLEYLQKYHLLPLDSRQSLGKEMQFILNSQADLILQNLKVDWAETVNKVSAENLSRMLEFPMLTNDVTDSEEVGRFLASLFTKMAEQDTFNFLIARLVDPQDLSKQSYGVFLRILRLIFASGQIQSTSFKGSEFVRSFLESQEIVFSENFIKRLTDNLTNSIDSMNGSSGRSGPEMQNLGDNDLNTALLQQQQQAQQSVRNESLMVLIYLSKYHERFRRFVACETDLLGLLVNSISCFSDDELFGCLVTYFVRELAENVRGNHRDFTQNNSGSSFMSSHNQMLAFDITFVEKLLFAAHCFCTLENRTHAYYSEIVFNGIDSLISIFPFLGNTHINLDKIFDSFEVMFKAFGEDMQSKILYAIRMILEFGTEKQRQKLISQSRLDMIFFELQKHDSPLRVQCLDLIKTLIRSGMILETMHSQVIWSLIQNRHSDEENMTIMKIFRMISERESEFILMGVLEKGMLEKMNKTILDSFENFKLDSLTDICFYDQPYLSFEFFADYIATIYAIALKNRNNKLEAFLTESFFKGFHRILTAYFASNHFCTMTINQRLPSNDSIHATTLAATHRLVYVILDTIIHFTSAHRSNLIIEALISRISNQFNYEIYKIYETTQIENIPINVQIEVQYVEIQPINLNTALGDRFKVPKDVPFSDFMRFIVHNFKEKMEYRVRNAADNIEIDDDESLSKAIRKCLIHPIALEDKMFHLKIKVAASPLAVSYPVGDFLPQQQLMYGSPQRAFQSIAATQQHQIMQQQQSSVRFIVFCKICQRPFGAQNQYIGPCLLCGNYAVNQYSYQPCQVPNISSSTTAYMLPYANQIPLPIHSTPPQMLVAPSPLQLSYSPISKMHNSYLSPNKLD